MSTTAQFRWGTGKPDSFWDGNCEKSSTWGTNIEELDQEVERDIVFQPIPLGIQAVVVPVLSKKRWLLQSSDAASDVLVRCARPMSSFV